MGFDARDILLKYNNDELEVGYGFHSTDPVIVERKDNWMLVYWIAYRGQQGYKENFDIILDVPLPFSGTYYRSGDYKFHFKLKDDGAFHLIRVQTRAEMDAEDAIEENSDGCKYWNEGRVLDAAREWRRAADKGNADAKENLQKFSSQIAAAQAKKDAEDRAREAARRAQEAREEAARKRRKFFATLFSLAWAAGGAAAFGFIPGFNIFRLIAGGIIGAIVGFNLDKNDIANSATFIGAGIGAIAIGIGTSMAGGLINTIIGLVVGAIGGGIIGLIFGKIFENKVLRIIFIVAVVAAVVYFGRPYFMPLVSSRFGKEKTAASATAAKTVTVTIDSLNLRERGYGDAEILKTLKKGDVLNVTGTDINGWLPVEHEGKHGYVGAQYVE